MQVSKHNGSKELFDMFKSLPNKEKLQSHRKYFFLEDPVKVKMPQNKIIKFKNHNRSFKVSSVVYADFKAFVEKKIVTNKIQKNVLEITVKNINLLDCYTIVS